MAASPTLSDRRMRAVSTWDSPYRNLHPGLVKNTGSGLYMLLLCSTAPSQAGGNEQTSQ